MSSWCDVVGVEVDDIEDLIGNVKGQDLQPTKRYLSQRREVLPKIRKKKKVEKPGVNNPIPRPITGNDHSNIPGTESIFVKTWGCSHNNSDGEYMAGQLAAYGYQITDDPDQAHLWLLNSCTVKTPAEQHFKNYIDKARHTGKHVVVSGCVPQAAPRDQYIYGLSVVGVQQIDRIVEVVDETLKGHTVRLLGSKKVGGRKVGGARLDLPKIRKNPLIEILAINTGCLNQCTYCKTKHARGELASYPIEQLVERAAQSFSEGCRELWLTSEDTGAYGIDLGVTLPQLLWRLVRVIPEGCMMRIGMTNPPYILKHLQEISEILNHPRVYAFLHVPVQSASDSVLMDMKREYCVEDFRHVVDFLRQRVPGISIATDVICGFPTETHEDFQETVDLVREYQFPSLFINQFFPRPGTPAARMRKVDTLEVKQRTRQISEVFQSYKPYDHKLGSQFDVLVTEISHDNKHYVGHNKYYEQVLVDQADPTYMGAVLRVTVTETGKHYMKARVERVVQRGQSLVTQPSYHSGDSNANHKAGSNKSNIIFSLLFTSLWVVIIARVLAGWNVI